MPITIKCPDCQKAYRLGDQLAGKKFRCKECGSTVAVPGEAFEDYEVLDDEDDDEPVPRTRRSKPTAKQGAKSVKSARARGNPLLWIGLGGGVFLLIVGLVVALIAGGRKPVPIAATGAPESPFPVAQVDVPPFPELGTPQVLPSGVRMWFIQMPPLPVPGGSMGMRLYLPPTDAPPQSIPCVLVAPAGTNLLVGCDMDADDYHDETLPYAEAGMAVVFYSLDGGLDMEEASNSEFTAAYRKFRAAHAGVVNGRNALEFVLRKVPQVDPRRIYTAGHSSAGTVSLLMAEHEPRLAGAIAYAPCTDVETRLQEISNNWILRSSFPDLKSFLKQSSPKTHVSHVGCPLFLFHASDDSNVPVSETNAFATQLRAAGKAVEFHTVPTGDHYDSMIQAGIPKAIEWLKQKNPDLK
jgi:dienelactone hydrolase